MANLIYKRVSTDQQSTDRQNLVLAEARIEDPVVFEEDPGTSSRLHPLKRPKFGELLTYARPGDAVHISEMFRLVRGTQHILDVLDVLHTGRLALRIHDGAFSAMDLTARHPRTGELQSTVKTLAAAGELQRDLQRELTYDGLRAAEAKGNKGGRRPAVPAGKTNAVRAAYLGGRSIAALAREHGVSRWAIRTAVADLMPEHAADTEGTPAPELPITLDWLAITSTRRPGRPEPYSSCWSSASPGASPPSATAVVATRRPTASPAPSPSPWPRRAAAGSPPASPWRGRCGRLGRWVAPWWCWRRASGCPTPSPGVPSPRT
jgi:DNA invertase Pin-like site-specific DNA recombinase